MRTYDLPPRLLMAKITTFKFAASAVELGLSGHQAQVSKEKLQSPKRLDK